MIVYIFRHGETYYSKNNLHYGDNYKSAEILPEYIPVIEKLANYLKGKLSDINYTSPFKRTVQTVEIVTSITGKKFVLDDRLEEEGLSRAEESLEEMESRLKSLLDEAKSLHTDSVALCSHGWPIAAMLAILTKGFVTKSDRGQFPKCGQLLIVEGTSIKTMDFN